MNPAGEIRIDPRSEIVIPAKLAPAGSSETFQRYISPEGTKDQYQTMGEIEPWVVGVTSAPQFPLRPRNLDKCNVALAMSYLSFPLQIMLLSEYKKTTDDALVAEFLHRFTFAESIALAFSFLGSYLASPPQPFLTTALKMHSYIFLPGIGAVQASLDARALCLPPRGSGKRFTRITLRPSSKNRSSKNYSALPVAAAATGGAVLSAAVISKLIAAASCGAAAGPAGALACAAVMP